MNIIFEDFKKEYIYEATRLALCEFERERKYNPDIPAKDYEEHISKLNSQQKSRSKKCRGNNQFTQ